MPGSGGGGHGVESRWILIRGVGLVAIQICGITVSCLRVYGMWYYS